MEFSNSDGLALAAILCPVLICLPTLSPTKPLGKGYTPISLTGWMKREGRKVLSRLEGVEKHCIWKPMAIGGKVLSTERMRWLENVSPGVSPGNFEEMKLEVMVSCMRENKKENSSTVVSYLKASTKLVSLYFTNSSQRV